MVNAALTILKIVIAYMTSSTALDALGAAAVVTGVTLLGGIAWGFIALGAALLLLSMAREARQAAT